MDSKQAKKIGDLGSSWTVRQVGLGPRRFLRASGVFLGGICGFLRALVPGPLLRVVMEWDGVFVFEGPEAVFEGPESVLEPSGAVLDCQ